MNVLSMKRRRVAVPIVYGEEPRWKQIQEVTEKTAGKFIPKTERKAIVRFSFHRSKVKNPTGIELVDVVFHPYRGQYGTTNIVAVRQDDEWSKTSAEIRRLSRNLYLRM